MRYLIFFSLLVLLANSALSENVFMTKQNMGKGGVLYWCYNSNSWGTETLYGAGDSRWFLFGISPLNKLSVKGVEVKSINYATLMLNLDKGHWPVKFVGLDSFIYPSFKRLTLLLRNTIEIDPRRGGVNRYSGRDYIGYKLNDNWQVQVQTEWKHFKSDFSQSAGMGWCYKISEMIELSSYLAVGTEKPYAKTGWFLLKAKVGVEK